MKIKRFHTLFIQIISLKTGNIVPSQATAMEVIEMTMNLEYNKSEDNIITNR